MNYSCTITPKILNLVVSITQQLAKFGQASAVTPEPKLRKLARAKTIFGTAAIEGNTLTLGSVGAILEGRPIISKQWREIQEIRNAAQAYADAEKFDPFSVKSFLKAHKIMMDELISKPGYFRSGQVGIWQDGKVRHVAPPAKRVSNLIESLFESLESANDLPMIVRAAIVHYEIEFIHPFADGNGRMGRLWQHVMLLKISKIFQYTPVESVIYAQQDRYYKSLRAADKAGDAAPFVEFSMETIDQSLMETIRNLKPKPLTSKDRLRLGQEKFDSELFSRIDYLKLHPHISTATASRDLAQGVKNGVLSMTGSQVKATYHFR